MINKNNYLENIIHLFDNQWYYWLGNYGYSNNYPNLYAFFPLIPLIINKFGTLGTIIINNICSLLSLYLIIYISKNIYKLKDKDILFISFLYALSPIHLNHIMLYTESIFLFLTLLVFIIYKNRIYVKNKIIYINLTLLLGFLIGLCINCRSLGFAILFGIGLDIIKDIFINISFIIKKGKEKEYIYNIKNKIIDGLIILFSSLSLGLLYPLYLYYKTKNPFYFINVQYDFWNREKTNIITIWGETFINLINSLLSNEMDIIDKIILSFEYMYCFSSFILFI